MSMNALSKIGKSAREVGIEAVWQQWGAIGASALQRSGRSLSSIIDPEGLLLLSLYLEPSERRLRDVLYWWAEVGSDLLSVQRTKTLLKRYPDGAAERLQTFGYWAAEKGGDKRWRSLASEDPSGPEPREGKGGASNLSVPPALMLRLRAGFGVSAKADVLSYLLGVDERRESTREAAEATGYSRDTVRGALQDLERAGFIQKTTSRPTRYSVSSRPWAELLGFLEPSNGKREEDQRLRGSQGKSVKEDVPAWRHWADVYAFLAEAAQLAEEAENKSDYLASSSARDVFERHEHVFEANRLNVPDPSRYQGKEYLDGFRETVDALYRWIEGNL